MSERTEAEALLRWLEESGRALELRVLRTLRRYSSVQHAVRYQDAESGKSREVDVLARFRGKSRGGSRSQLDVVIECKTGKPGSQWVAFRDETSPANFAPQEDAWLTTSVSDGRPGFTQAWERRPPFSSRINVSSIVTAHDGKDSAHGAHEQLMAAVAGQIRHVRMHEEEPKITYDKVTQSEIAASTLTAGVMGIVVTTVPLYVADLDETNKPHVSPANIVAVPTGLDPERGPERVFFARESALGRMVRDLDKAAEII